MRDKLPQGYALDVFVEFPCNSVGVRVARVASELKARRIARRFGHAVTTWKIVSVPLRPRHRTRTNLVQRK